MNCDPSAVLAASVCLFMYADNETLDWIQIYLLCQIANS